MTIENSVSTDFWSTFVDGTNVFDCRLSMCTWYFGSHRPQWTPMLTRPAGLEICNWSTSSLCQCEQGRRWLEWDLIARQCEKVHLYQHSMCGQKWDTKATIEIIPTPSCRKLPGISKRAKLVHWDGHITSQCTKRWLVNTSNATKVDFLANYLVYWMSKVIDWNRSCA